MLNAGKTACFQGYFYHLRQPINNLNPIFPDLYLRKIKGLNVKIVVHESHIDHTSESGFGRKE